MEGGKLLYGVLHDKSQKRLKEKALVLLGNFNYPDICWKGNTARHTQSQRFLQSIDDNILTQVVEEPKRRGALLDLVLTKKD
ncbi:glycerol kinase [Limosa lapponica baueri]|uniref:Glycerol kinase n=1 Tax=Limosa lapponica baueri TaxID=1758121 RepID=A0A2I0TPE4_LIMLA|nr:glycerol kinase [Limosa lapponica baueri]